MDFDKQISTCTWKTNMKIRSNTVHKKEISTISRRIEICQLDAADRAILRELIADARIARAELARRVRLSAPAVAERVRRLEDKGVITGYRATIAPSALGYGLSVLIRARPSPGRMKEMVAAIEATPQIVQCDRVSGDDCFIALAHVRDVGEMEALIDRLVPFGATNSSVIQSATVAERTSTLLGL